MTPETDNDSALLRQFAEESSEPAFAALVERHLNLVYSVALRHVRDPHQAEEIAQAVFIILARKAAGIRNLNALPSWLFQTTRLTANNFLRSELRRRNREQEAYMQSEWNESSAAVWMQIEPLLDSAVGALGENDRRAILLRFYQGKTLPAVGEALGVSEAAAEKRVSRAVEKLRRFFGKKGVTVSAGIISMAVATNSVQAAPAGLVSGISTGAVIKGVAIGNSTAALVNGVLKAMAWSKVKIALAVGVALLLVPAALTTATLLSTHPVNPFLRITGTAQIELLPGSPEIVQTARYTILTDGKSYRITMDSKGSGNLENDFYDRRADYASDGTDVFVLSDQPYHRKLASGQMSAFAYPGRDLPDVPLTAKAIWLAYCSRDYFEDPKHHTGFKLEDDFRMVWPPAVTNLVSYQAGSSMPELITGWSRGVIASDRTDSRQPIRLVKLTQYPNGFKAMTFSAKNFTNIDGMTLPLRLELDTFFPKSPKTATTGEETLPLRKATFVAESVEVMKGPLDLMPVTPTPDQPIEDWRFKDIAGNYIVESHATGNSWPVRGSAEFNNALAQAKKLAAANPAYAKITEPEVIEDP
ncbi:MAG TPA: sigma-70 family RNA polymerase sigma factor [Candidatus Sulfotelmatobacter sp.]|jgi:RNA polymerase sigma factor (sigma-70 family)|nr:sigma-70 family RNA polymerase sigma factor [Candidatus Sulfotelmatobacter sp.]